MSEHVRYGCVLAALLCLSAVLGRASAQESAEPRDPGQKSVHMVRTATPPVIDGVLDDAVWATAAFIDDLHQVNPIEYAAPSERTEILLLYDDNALYVAAKLYTNPDDITANMLRQNSSMTNDDTIFVTIDPFNTRRGGYFFGVNANAVRMDGLYRNVSEYYGDWDTIFDVKTSRFDGGWVAEYEIPFKSISFDPNTDTWGLNFSRSLQFRDEEMAWVTRNRRWDPSSAGLAVGFEGLEQGIGLDVVPSASMTDARSYATGESESDFEPSLDLVYKITPALNGSLTINTDFSATEVDDRQVNLTRFGLFFPEKRDFFLHEADIFEFGRIGASDGNGAISNAERQNGRPFFSRRIGLGPAGEVVDLDYGGKVSGRVGRFEIGALSIRQDEHLELDATTLSVLRAKAGIGSESTVGVIFTDGDPLTSVDNSLAGADFLYRNSRLPGGRVLEAGAWYQQSETAGIDGDDSAFGIGLSIPSNARFRGGISVKEFEANFYPALGFIEPARRARLLGPRRLHASAGDSYWQSLYFVLDGQRIEKLDGGLQSQAIGLTPFQLTNRTGDVLFGRSSFQQEVLDTPFEISPGIVIPPGDYSFDEHGLEIQFSGFRKVSGRITRTEGEFYDGTRSRTVRQFHLAALASFPHECRSQHQRHRAAAGQFHDADRLHGLRHRVLVDAVLGEPNPVRQRERDDGRQHAPALDSGSRSRVLLRDQPQPRGPRSRRQLPLGHGRRRREAELHLPLLGAVEGGEEAPVEVFFVREEGGGACVAELTRHVETIRDVCKMALLLAEHALQRQRMLRALEGLLIEAVKPEGAKLDDHRHVQIHGARAALPREGTRHRGTRAAENTFARPQARADLHPRTPWVLRPSSPPGASRNRRGGIPPRCASASARRCRARAAST